MRLVIILKQLNLFYYKIKLNTTKFVYLQVLRYELSNMRVTIMKEFPEIKVPLTLNKSFRITFHDKKLN